MTTHRVVCEDCEGRGYVYDSNRIYGQQFAPLHRCMECEGEGTVEANDDITFFEGMMYAVMFFIVLVALGNAIELILQYFGT